MSGGGERVLGSALGDLLGSTEDADAHRQLTKLVLRPSAHDYQLMMQDFANRQGMRALSREELQAREFRLADGMRNAMQVDSVPVHAHEHRESTDCKGCGAAVARHLRDCEYCGRPR